MNSRKRPVPVLLAALVLCFFGQATFAQQLPRYAPVRPPISPYFNYFRGNTAGLPQYYFFLQPQLQNRAFVTNQTTLNAYQNLRLTDVERRLRTAGPRTFVRPRDAAAGRGAAGQPPAAMSRRMAGTPSTASTFLNYLHFYPAAAAGRGR